MAEDPCVGCWRCGKNKHRENQPRTKKESFRLETHHGPREDSNAAAKGPAGKKHGPPRFESSVQPEAPSSLRIRVDVDYDQGPDRPHDPNCFCRDCVFEAVVAGDPELLNGLSDHLREKSSHLTDSTYRVGETGKTCLMKALLHLKDGKNPTIPELLKIDKETQDLEKKRSLVNTACTGSYYKGQTALHIAIEKRSLDLVKRLVENGADVHAKASGFLFQQDYRDLHFYFGELPLSLAACTNQPEVVKYLLDNPHQKAKLDKKDSMGNTVLHALVMVANDTKKNTKLVVNMYNMILTKGAKIDPSCKLEAIKNKEQLTPLTLAVKTGKVKILKYMFRRKMKDPKLSRKFIEWTYGPIQTSVYDMTFIDSREENSALEVLAYNSDIPNRTAIVALQPLNKLLQHKWESCIKKRFYFSLFLHLAFMVIFTATAYHWPPKDEPLVPTETFLNLLRFLGAVVVLIGGIYLFIAQIVQFWRRRFSLISLLKDSCFDIFLFVQALSILVSSVMFFANNENYVVFMVFALLLGWVNLLYYTRGFQQVGISIVMIQEAVLRDLYHFLIVYGVLLVGFATALIILTGGASTRNASLPLSDDAKDQVVYSGPLQTALLLFKFTIGMGDLEYHENLKHSRAAMLIIFLFVVLTYILLLNMLIALMSETVTKVSGYSQSIWQLQRAVAILEMEKNWIWFWKKDQRDNRFVSVDSEDKEQERWFFRVEEVRCGDLTGTSVLRDEPMETKTLATPLPLSHMSSSGKEEEEKDERKKKRMEDLGAQEERSPQAERLSEETPLIEEECRVQL